MNNKKSNTKQKNEFRIHKPSGHPSYIYEQQGDEYKHLGLTHSEYNKKTNTKNIKLDKNPNPQDPRDAFVKPYAEHDRINKFRERKMGWFFSKKDKQKINELKQ